MQSTTDKKVNQKFQTKKGFVTCLKLMINELTRFPTRSENVYFANMNKHQLQSLLFLFCTCRTHLIKFKLYNNQSAQAVNSLLSEIRRNQSNLRTFKN